MPIARGESYMVNLNPVQGREQAGTRPVLVVSADAINQLPLVVSVMVGTKGANIARDYPTNVRARRHTAAYPSKRCFWHSSCARSTLGVSQLRRPAD
jgi:mRNA interferase MazF